MHSKTGVSQLIWRTRFGVRDFYTARTVLFIGSKTFKMYWMWCISFYILGISRTDKVIGAKTTDAALGTGMRRSRVYIYDTAWKYRLPDPHGPDRNGLAQHNFQRPPQYSGGRKTSKNSNNHSRPISVTLSTTMWIS